VKSRIQYVYHTGAYFYAGAYFTNYIWNVRNETKFNKCSLFSIVTYTSKFMGIKQSSLFTGYHLDVILRKEHDM